MSSPRTTRGLLAVMAACSLLLSGCSASSSTGEENAHQGAAPVDGSHTDSDMPQDSQNTDNGSSPDNTSSSANDADTPKSTQNDCFIHLFDGDDFDEHDSNFVLTAAGENENLDALPGAKKSWTDEADSVKVGPSATVTIYSQTNFGGTATTLKPGSEHPDLDDEPYSLKMVCS